MPLTIVMFPESFQELNKEITYHPKLQEMLSIPENSNLDYQDKFALISIYAGVVLDGVYTAEDQIKLAEVLTQRLRKMRAEIILLN